MNNWSGRPPQLRVTSISGGFTGTSTSHWGGIRDMFHLGKGHFQEDESVQKEGTEAKHGGACLEPQLLGDGSRRMRVPCRPELQNEIGLKI